MEEVVQASGTLCGGSLLVDVGALQELLVLGLEKRITSAGLGEDEKSHGAGEKAVARLWSCQGKSRVVIR